LNRLHHQFQKLARALGEGVNARGLLGPGQAGAVQQRPAAQWLVQGGDSSGVLFRTTVSGKPRKTRKKEAIQTGDRVNVPFAVFFRVF
jgi:hypothetical protein